MQLSEGRAWVAVGLRGCHIAPENEGLRLVTPGIVVMGQGPLNLFVAYGRGRHDVIEVEWPVDELRMARQGQGVFAIAAPTPPDRWRQLLNDHDPGADLRWVSAILEAISRPHSSELAEEIPKPIRELARDVKQQPAAPWRLQEAAYHAGYSAYHLSRAFRRHFGLGFPDYVRLCRAEAAVSFLSSGKESPDEIARACGLSHAVALRTALKSSCGFLPAEVRTLSVSIV